MFCASGIGAVAPSGVTATLRRWNADANPSFTVMLKFGLLSGMFCDTHCWPLPLVPPTIRPGRIKATVCCQSLVEIPGFPISEKLITIWVGTIVEADPNWKALARTFVIRITRVMALPGASIGTVHLSALG